MLLILRIRLAAHATTSGANACVAPTRHPKLLDRMLGHCSSYRNYYYCSCSTAYSATATG